MTYVKWGRWDKTLQRLLHRPWCRVLSSDGIGYPIHYPCTIVYTNATRVAFVLGVFVWAYWLCDVFVYLRMKDLYSRIKRAVDRQGTEQSGTYSCRWYTNDETLMCNISTLQEQYIDSDGDNDKVNLCSACFWRTNAFGIVFRRCLKVWY